MFRKPFKRFVTSGMGVFERRSPVPSWRRSKESLATTRLPGSQGVCRGLPAQLVTAEPLYVGGARWDAQTSLPRIAEVF